MLISEAFLGDEPFVMYLGDNLLKEGIAPFVRTFEQNDPDALILLQKVADPQSYGIAELDGDGCVVRLVEKPAEPAQRPRLVGVYLFTPAIFESVKAIRPRPRGELEITDAIQHLVDRGLRVRAARGHRLVEGHRQARGHARGQPAGARHHRQPTSAASSSRPRSRGRCTSAKAAASSAARSAARWSSAPAAGSAIRFVGPYTSISDGVVVDHAELEHSIVLENSRISHLGTRMADSLIGRDCVIAHSDARPVAYRFLVGDSCQIGIL